MDVSPKQIVSVATALIPFLEHDDANRALMGANMQRQAVPLLRPQAPIIGTGMEYRAAKDSGGCVLANEGRRSHPSTPSRSSSSTTNGLEQAYDLLKFTRSNAGTCINQTPIVEIGERVDARPDPRGRTEQRSRRDGARPKRARRVHAVGRLQLRRRDPDLASGWSRTIASPRFTSKSTSAKPATRSSGPKRSRATSPTSAKTRSRISMKTASSASAPRFVRKTSSSARSRPRARPS
jgi:hypothetical protein